MAYIVMLFAVIFLKLLRVYTVENTRLLFYSDSEPCLYQVPD